MSKFVLIFRGGAVATRTASPSEVQAHLEKWRTWLDGLARDGIGQGGQRLQTAGVTVRGRQRTVTDGPFAETKDLITGSLVIEAASLEKATDIARECPVYEFDGSVEVRPIFEGQA